MKHPCPAVAGRAVPGRGVRRSRPLRAGRRFARRQGARELRRFELADLHRVPRWRRGGPPDVERNSAVPREPAARDGYESLEHDRIVGLLAAQEQAEAGVHVQLLVGLRVEQLLEEADQVGVRVLLTEHHRGVAPHADALVLSKSSITSNSLVISFSDANPEKSLRSFSTLLQ